MLCFAKAMQLYQELGFSHMVFEGDAKQVIDIITGKSVDCSWKGRLVEDIQFFMERQANWKVVFTKRGGNQVANVATQFARGLISESMWIEEGPYEVMASILRDKGCIVS